MDTPQHRPSQPAAALSESQKLRSGRLGVIGIVFFVIAAAAPLVGRTGALPAAIVLGRGSAAPGAYLLAGAVAEGVDPTTTAWGLSARGWFMLVPFATLDSISRINSGETATRLSPVAPTKKPATSSVAGFSVPTRAFW